LHDAAPTPTKAKYVKFGFLITMSACLALMIFDRFLEHHDDQHVGVILCGMHQHWYRSCYSNNYNLLRLPLLRCERWLLEMILGNAAAAVAIA
jgi:hypothetical protein